MKFLEEMASNRGQEMYMGRKTQVCKNKGKTNNFEGTRACQGEACKLSLEYELVI